MFEGSESGLDTQISLGFFYNTVGWIYFKDPACVRGFTQIVCCPCLPLASATSSRRAVLNPRKKWEAVQKNRDIINDNIWADLSTTHPNKQGTELIFHKECKFIQYFEGDIKLLSAVLKLREVFREFCKHLKRYILFCKLCQVFGLAFTALLV